MIKIKAAAKINLFLDVLGKRKDGYHNIDSLILPISLFDTITIKNSPKNISTHISPVCYFEGIPWPFSMGNNDENLITHAARFLKKHTGYKKGAAIFLTKRIPIGAGLGGGSADAAAVLNGLNRLWKTGLSLNQLIEVGTQIGCDVPALIHGGAVRMQGRGEITAPIDPPVERDFWMLLVYPGLPISTGDIYRRFSQCHEKRAARNSVRRKYQRIISGLGNGSLQTAGNGLFNALQETVFHKYPLLEMIKNSLENLGAKQVLLTGSGSTVFALLKCKKEGEEMAKMIRQKIASPLWTRIVHTIGKQSAR